jgi:hypothetical protein
MGVPPEIWGPNLWGTLHLVCIAGTITPEFVQEFTKVIPCPMCAGHFADISKENPLPESSDPFVLFEWSVYLHNLVNERIGKPIFTVEQALERWTSPVPAPVPDADPHFDFKIFIILALLASLIFILLRK